MRQDSFCLLASPWSLPAFLGDEGFPFGPAVWLVQPTWQMLQMASVAWCVEGMLSLNIQPRTGSHGAKRSCASVPTTSEAAWTPSCAARISLTPKPQGSASSLPWCFLPHTPGWAILPGFGVEHVFNILSCPDWSRGYSMNYFWSNLFKCLLLLRAPLKILLLLGHLIEKVYNLAVIWDVHPPKPQNF